MVEGQVIETTTQPQASVEPHPTTADTKRPGEPTEQPAAQVEAPP
jgi:hypothetical protein